MPLLKEFLRKKALDCIGGVYHGGSPDEISNMMFVSDSDQIVENRLKEYNVWYEGIGDNLLSFYAKNNMMDFQAEPVYWRNKKNYFWTVSSSEGGIKRTHSGQPANIISTLTDLVGRPTYSADSANGDRVYADSAKGTETEKLDEVLTECGFWEKYMDEQIPMTLVEGWGCWKVSWDLDVSDHPTLKYYRARDVDFIWKSGKTVGVIFKDWYRGKNDQRYLVTEMRYLKSRRREDGRLTKDLYIETEAWSVSGSDSAGLTSLSKTDLGMVPELAGAEQTLVINDYDTLLARPCIFYKGGDENGMPGRSVFQNKIDLFDDLDQELSQQSGCVRESTPVEYIGSDYLERDPATHLPQPPKTFTRHFIVYKPMTSTDGTSQDSSPVTVTQPTVDFNRYGTAVSDTMSQILSGILSPATMGIGVAVQSSADSQREKEKVTVATRARLTSREGDILKGLFSDLLCAEEYLRTGEIVNKKRDITVEWSEFGQNTFEQKAAVLSGLLDNGDISPKRYMDRLYGNTLSKSDYEDELAYLEKVHDPERGGMGISAVLGDGTDGEAVQDPAVQNGTVPLSSVQDGYAVRGSGEE